MVSKYHWLPGLVLGSLNIHPVVRKSTAWKPQARTSGSIVHFRHAVRNEYLLHVHSLWIMSSSIGFRYPVLIMLSFLDDVGLPPIYGYGKTYSIAYAINVFYNSENGLSLFRGVSLF